MPETSFLEAQLIYESLGSIDLDAAIEKLDASLSDLATVTWQTLTSEGQSVTVGTNTKLRYGANGQWVYKTASGLITANNSFFGSDPAPGVGKVVQQGSGGSQTSVENAFAPIAEYYSKLVSVNETLRKHINKTATNIASADPRILSEERYSNRIHPEESVMPREASNNFFPELRQSSLPYIISASIFMALLSIFLIFQMNGFSGQINVPPGIAAWFASPAPGAEPFYKNPVVIGGIVTILVTALVIFIILYFQAKNTNRSRQ